MRSSSGSSVIPRTFRASTTNQVGLAMPRGRPLNAGGCPMTRLLLISIAWLVGTGLYLVAAVRDRYDGFPDVLLLPVCAAAVSAAVVLSATLIGLGFRRTPLNRLWRSSGVWAAIAAGGSLAVLGFGSAVGLTGEYTHPDTGERFEALHPAAALGGYFLLAFAIVHWPLGRAPVSA